MVLLDLLTIAGIPTAVGASEAVHQQKLLDEEAEAPERQEPFYLDVYCDAQSRKKDEVHGAIVVLKDGKVFKSTAYAGCAQRTNNKRSFDFGPKTPKPDSQKLIPMGAILLTLSPVSSTLSRQKTSTCRTVRCPRLPYSVL